MSGKEEEEKKQEKKEKPQKSSQSQHSPSEGKVEIEYLSPQGEAKKSQKREEEGEDKEKSSKLKNKLEKKEKELHKLKKELKEAKEEQLRQLAERENLRKRLDREKNEYYQYALSEFIKDLLVVLDNFERALEAQEGGKDFKEGIEMIYKQYKDVLKKQGVHPVEIEDGEFDPNFQQALITEESEEVEKKEVSEVMQKGYMLHNRLLRPALVKVAVPKKEDKEKEKKEKKED